MDYEIRFCGHGLASSTKVMHTVVDVNIDKTTFPFTSLQVNKEKLPIDSLSLFPCLCVYYPCCLKAW